MIENADSTVASLAVGDILAYPYGDGNIIIVKVASVSVDGTTVTITGGELEMEEAFAAVKIDSATPYYEVDASTADEGVTYLNSGVQARNYEGSGSHVSASKIELDFLGDAVTDAKITGSVETAITTSLVVYVTKSYQKLEIKFDTDITFAVNFEGTLGPEKGISLGNWKVYVLPGISVNMKVELLFEFTGTITAEFKVSSTIGVALEHRQTGWKPRLICSTPTVDGNFKADIKLFAGMKLTPAVKILEGALADAKIEGKLGVEICACIDNITNEEGGSCSHDCLSCLDGEIYFTYEVKPSITLFNRDWLRLEVNWANVKIKFIDFYWSCTFDEWGWGTCPYISYRTTFVAMDEANNRVEGAKIALSSGEILTTDRKGIAVTYLPNGIYTARTEINGVAIRCRFKVSDYSKKLIMTPLVPDRDYVRFGSVDSETLTDYGKVLATGTCGNTVYWTLYESGMLYIYGSGDMTNYESNSNTPWYKKEYLNDVTEIYIEDGVASIGDRMFYLMRNLQTVSIPESVTYIGDRAFCWCTELKEVILPDGLTYLGLGAFEYCHDLSGIIVIPDGITEIKSYTFSGNASNDISEIILPDGLQEIGYAAFYKCGITQITIPASVTYIGGYAFRYCENLEKIVFTGDAPEIVSYAIEGTTTTAYYPADNETWTASFRKNFRNITWIPYTLDEDGNMVVNDVGTEEAVPNGEVTPEIPSVTDDLVIEESPETEVSPNAAFGGDYTTEVYSTYTLKTASFTGLVPGADYVMLAMASIDAEDVLAADNLLGILQGTAAEDGTLVFQYIQRVDTEVSYVVVCGPSGKNLADATITFPEMTADGELQVVDPTVVYGGKTLTEGVDYEITGTVDFTEPGEYTCQIRGIHNYTGTVTCTYTVTETDVLLGDLNGDGEIDLLDANLIVSCYNGTVDLTEEQLLAADLNGDGEIDLLDANLIVSYYNGTIDSFPAEK